MENILQIFLRFTLLIIIKPTIEINMFYCLHVQNRFEI